MVETLPAPQNIITDAWVPTSWDEFLAIAARPELEKARCYYDATTMLVG
jgi:rubrerythrin